MTRLILFLEWERLVIKMRTLKRHFNYFALYLQKYRYECVTYTHISTRKYLTNLLFIMLWLRILCVYRTIFVVVVVLVSKLWYIFQSFLRFGVGI